MGSFIVLLAGRYDTMGTNYPSLSYLCPSSKHGQIALLLVVIALTSGCLGFLGAETEASTATTDVDPIDSVPENVDAVAQADGDLLTDNATAQLMDEMIELGMNRSDEMADHPGELGNESEAVESWDGLLASLDEKSELDISEFHRATAFASVDHDEEYGAVIIESNWESDEIVESSDELADAETTTYNDVTVYVSEADGETTWTASFGNGTVAVGTETAVRDVIDTRHGEMDSFGGELRAAYEAAGDGLLKAAVASPMETLDEQTAESPGEDEGIEDELMGEMLPNPEVMVFVYDTDGDQLQFETQLTMESAEEAADFAGILELAGSIELVGEPFDSILADLDIEQDENIVSIGYESTAAEIRELIELAAAFDRAEGVDSPVSDAVAGA